MELEGTDDLGIADREWNKLSNDFVTAGYREGITEGKNRPFRRGLTMGSHRLVHRSVVRSVYSEDKRMRYLHCARQHLAQLEVEVREIVQGLSRLKLSTLAPPDMQAIEHAREHESDAPDVGDVETNNQMGDLEDAFESLSTSKSAGKEDVMRRSVEAMAELDRLRKRLESVYTQLTG
ncbi:Essential protein Yae1, N terminal [Rhizoctonia solani]|uniref:Essential protein Yae1, N terminal n=1 Tax=Rhizoctonia solani TaxID=456999 RepID=A0A8H7M4T3_9AGAM|nr:Essential protein Yae1, N terminal [Rhizoctonia solani]